MSAPRRSKRLAAMQASKTKDIVPLTPSPSRRLSHTKRLVIPPEPRIVTKKTESCAKAISVVTPDASSRRQTKSRRSTINPSLISIPSSIVRFGANTNAIYDTTDPPNRFELMPTTMDSNDNDTEEHAIVFDEETRNNAAVLAEWDDISESSSDMSLMSFDSGCGDHAVDNNDCGFKRLVKEQEIKDVPSSSSSPNVTSRRGQRDRSPKKVTNRPILQREEVFCKHCNRGVIRTTHFIYE